MADHFFISEPYDVDKGKGVEISIFHGDDQLVFEDIPDAEVYTTKKRAGIKSKDGSKHVAVEKPGLLSRKVGLFRKVSGKDETKVATIPASFAKKIASKLKAGKARLLEDNLEVSIPAGGSGLDIQGGRTKRNRRGGKHRQLRKLTARRR
jgi:hypothetical protein